MIAEVKRVSPSAGVLDDQIEPVARIHVAELDEPGEALGQHRVDRDAAGREVVPLRVDERRAAPA